MGRDWSKGINFQSEDEYVLYLMYIQHDGYS